MRIGRRGIVVGLGLLAAGMGHAGDGAAPTFSFAAIEGGEIDTAGWRGRPVLVVNTASLCGFTPQFDGLQALQDRYGAAGLVVLAVPSDDFRQELSDASAVKEFCAVNFDLTLPMTTITPVLGRGAHPFYRWMADDHGFVPGWNFNKVLLGLDGQPVGTWGSAAQPLGGAIEAAIKAQLG